MARPSVDGERVHVILTRAQLKFLKTLTKKTGLTMSDLVRRAVDGLVRSEQRRTR